MNQDSVSQPVDREQKVDRRAHYYRNGPLGSAKLDLKVLLSNQHLNVTNFAKLQVGLVLRNLYTGTYNPNKA